MIFTFANTVKKRGFYKQKETNIAGPKKQIFIELVVAVALKFGKSVYIRSSNYFNSIHMQKQLLLFVLLFTSLFSVAQQSKLDEAWELFNTNKPKDAIKKFNEAAKNTETAEEALLALVVINTDEGNTKEAMENFSQFYKVSSNPYPYMDVLFYTSGVANGNGKKAKERIKFLETLLKDPKLPGTIKAKIHSTLGNHYEVIGKFKEAKKEFAQIGSIVNWMAVGSFENTSASGYDKNYEPIDNPSVTKTFKNKYGANVNWFTLKEARLDRWVDNEYYLYAGNSVVYSQTFVNSTTEQDVQFRIGVSGSVKVWLNDNLVLSESEERNNGIDSYWAGVTLKQGYNRILIQIGESEADNSNFMLRITDENGDNISGLTFDDKKDHEYDKSSVNVKPLSRATLAFFEQQVKENPSFLNHLLLSKAYLNLDMRLQARKTLKKAEEMAPKSSYVQLKLVQVYQSEGNRTAIAKVVEWLKDNDKNNVISLDLFFDEAIENENYEKADSILKSIVAELGNLNESVLEKKMSLYGAQEKNEDLIRIIDVAYDNYPENYLFVLYKSILEQSKKNNAGAMKVLQKFTKKNYNIAAYKRLAGMYFENSQIASGLGIYEKLIEDDPIAVGIYYELADIYIQLRRYDDAITLMDKAIEIAPYIGKYWSLRAKCYTETGKDAVAKTNYKRAIELTPTYFDARRKLRKLNGKKEDIFSNFDEVDVYAAFAAAGKAEDYPDDNSVILVNSVQRVVYDDGVSEEKHTIVAKVFNSAGIDDWKEYGIGYYGTQNVTVEKVEVLKANGSKLEAERNGGNIVFTNLEAGDGIHLTYRVENYQSGKLAPHFTDQHYFNLFYPVVKSSYSLLIHPDVKFKHEFSNGGFEPEKGDREGFDYYHWEKKDVPALKSESFMSQIADFGEVLFISSFPDWKFISNWYSDLAKTKAKSDYEVKELATELFKGKENLSKIEKVKVIHNYIVENVRYSSVSFRQSGLIPQKASKVINTRVGDCKDVSTLFVALCREAGVDSARLVLINTRDNGVKDLFLPSIDFNHCIGNVTADGQEYFVELTSDKNGFGTFPNTLKKAFALKIYDESEGVSEEPFYLNPKTKMPDNIERTATVEFSGKDMNIDIKSLKTGDWASDMRYTYADIPESEKRKKLLQSLSSDNANVKLNSFSFEALDAISDSLNYTYKYSMGNAVTVITGLNIFTIPWSDKIAAMSFMSNEERKYPINFWDYIEFDKAKETITITFPGVTKLAEVPKNVTLSCSAAEYKVTYKVQGSTLIAVREMKTKKDVITPAEYEELRKFFEKVVEEDTRQLAFK